MQYLFSYLHFFSAFLYLTLGLVIIIKDHNERLNQACAGVMFCFFIWSISTVWVHHPATPEGVARIFADVAAIGWLFYSSFHLWFAWLYTKRKPFRFFKPVAVLFFAFPGLLLSLQLTKGVMIDTFQYRSYGWFTPWESSLWSPLFLFYCGFLSLMAFWLIYDYGRKNENVFVKRQSAIIIVTGLTSLVSGFLANVFLSFFIPEGFPSIGDIMSLVWAGGLAFVAIRYNMLNITPFIAANRIVATMKDLLFLLDTDGRIISVNSSAMRVLGCEMQQLSGRRFQELVDDGDRGKSELKDKMFTEPSYVVETALAYCSGPFIPVELSTSLIPGTGIVCVAHDITLQKQRTEYLQEEKKQLESQVLQATEELRQINNRLLSEVQEKKMAVDALEESEERFRIIFEHAPDGIYLIDRNGNFIDGNNEAVRIIGFNKYDIVGKNLFGSGLLSPEDSDTVAGLISGENNDEQSGYRELILTRADGSEIPVEAGSHLLQIGEKCLNVCIVRDLSERKMAEKEAEELRNALHLSQKMDAVGRLAGGIAHDFNNLLGGIIGYAGLLSKRFNGRFPAEVKVLGKIIDVSKQAADRTAKLLAFARKGKYNVEPVDMHMVISDVVNLMRYTIDPKIVVTSHADAEHSIVKGNRSQLHSALLNLGVNARDALPGGGNIDFSTENVTGREITSADFIPDEQAVTYMKIVVKDDGTGMDELTASRVFEPFFSTKGESKGTGLGLPSVYGTIIQHGGTINLESEPGKGTEFILYLPLCNTITSSVEVPDSPSPNETTRGGNVLIVDDTPLIREVMEDALLDEGYTVHSCEDGNEALAWYRKHFKELDLVVLDYTMPGINGKECYERMKEIQPSIKTIITSGHAVDGDIEKTLEAGAFAFLQKPFEVNDLIALVNNVLSGRVKQHVSEKFNKSLSDTGRTTDADDL